ncbi:hypothetical protein [Ensifer sp. B1-9]|uniref:hypothetical protein n=1 Tax=Ensifer sp. B1-9 TaxID=3141455 RepID=UPI003D196C24
MTRLLMVLGLVAINPLAWGWYGGFKANAEWQAQGVKEARERNYPVVCGAYFDTSLWERWTTPRWWEASWCEDYKERL